MENNPAKLGVKLLVALAVGSTVGSGIFGLPQNMVAGAGAGALVLGWTLSGLGMMMLTLGNGVYADAQALTGPLLGYAFCRDTFKRNFWGAPALGSVLNHVKSTTLVTVWVFSGMSQPERVAESLSAPANPGVMPLWLAHQNKHGVPSKRERHGKAFSSAEVGLANALFLIAIYTGFTWATGRLSL